MAPDMPGVDKLTTNSERAIVTIWAEACPTLRTIILPMGQVWYSEDKAWRCYADAQEMRATEEDNQDTQETQDEQPTQDEQEMQA